MAKGVLGEESRGSEWEVSDGEGEGEGGDSANDAGAMITGQGVGVKESASVDGAEVARILWEREREKSAGCGKVVGLGEAVQDEGDSVSS